MDPKDFCDKNFYRNLSKILEPYILQKNSIICFDSGENSKRNYYIHKTLKYLINDRGIPTLVLNDSNVH